MIKIDSVQNQKMPLFDDLAPQINSNEQLTVEYSKYGRLIFKARQPELH